MLSHYVFSRNYGENGYFKSYYDEKKKIASRQWHF